MNYELCLEFLYGQLPMFQQQGKKALRYDLSNIIRLCDQFQNPQHQFKSVHIAGTNGKGSVSHQLASILQHAGSRVGLYTSPHLVDFRERIRIDGHMIDKDFIAEFVGKHMSFWNSVQPSFFELTTLMAFVYFAYEKVDIAVIETGLGGRLDSTNVIRPLLSVITNIAFDHTDILGSTLDQIAFEKAGIIKPNTPVVIGETHEQTLPVFKAKATAENAPLYVADEQYEAIMTDENFDSFDFEIRDRALDRVVLQGSSDLLGCYQLKNIVTSFTAVEVLLNAGIHIPQKAIVEGFKNVKDKTGLNGRWQVIQKNPMVVCDTAHNPAGIGQVVQQLAMLKPRRLHIIVGFSADKDIDQMLKIFSAELGQSGVTYYYTRSSVKRTMDAEQLAQKAGSMGIGGDAYEQVNDAFEVAMSKAGVDDVIFVGGSNFVVGDFLKYCIVK